MAGRSSRNKGANGEREVIALLQPVVNKVCEECGQVQLILKRNYTQRYEAKQYDVEGLPWMALEVKRVENQSGIEGWWRQCLAATREGQTPVLFYRQNNKQWKIRLRTGVRAGDRERGRMIIATVTMDLPTFLIWLEQRLIAELRR